MKSKEEYLRQDGSIERFKFNADIRRAARDSQRPVSGVLKEFFDGSQFTKREMGKFALHTSSQESLVDGAVTLIHALGLTEEQAPSLNILLEYFGASPSDPQILGMSWNIDTMLNWKQGTVMPESRQYLARL